MKKFIACFVICSLSLISCEHYTQKIYTGTIVADLTDSSIINQLNTEMPMIVSSLTPPQLNRCEGIKIDVIPIGSTVENQIASISYPSNGPIAEDIGNYALDDSNTAKFLYLTQQIKQALTGFNTISKEESQIFYTINYTLQHNTARCIIYSDLLENRNQHLSFYKSGYDLETMCKKLSELYNIDMTVKTVFHGKLTIVTPLVKHQDQILYARKFYKYYFDKIGLSSAQYEFIGSISQSKFKSNI